MKDLAQNASFDSQFKGAPSKPGIKHLAGSAAMCGNVRVGLEDSLWIGYRTLDTSNAEQVTRARSIIEGLGLEIATPEEARAILQLKGADKVNF